jgi:hypothetical protein
VPGHDDVIFVTGNAELWPEHERWGSGTSAEGRQDSYASRDHKRFFLNITALITYMLGEEHIGGV